MSNDSFDQHLERVLDPAFRLAMTMLNDRAAAEDAVQEASLKAWRHQDRFRPGAELRPWFLAMGEGGFDERVTAAAALITDIHVRTIGLQRALREGAGGEPALAELLATQEANRRVSTGQGMALVLRRSIPERELDLFWAQTCPEVYDALVNRSGWSTEEYATWVASLLENLKGEL